MDEKINNAFVKICHQKNCPKCKYLKYHPNCKYYWVEDNCILKSALHKHTLKAEIKVLQEALMGFEIDEMIKTLKAELRKKSQ